jgi:hypothetical protein
MNSQRRFEREDVKKHILVESLAVQSKDEKMDGLSW